MLYYIAVHLQFASAGVFAADVETILKRFFRCLCTSFSLLTVNTFQHVSLALGRLWFERERDIKVYARSLSFSLQASRWNMERNAQQPIRSRSERSCFSNLLSVSHTSISHLYRRLLLVGTYSKISTAISVTYCSFMTSQSIFFIPSFTKSLPRWTEEAFLSHFTFQINIFCSSCSCYYFDWLFSFISYISSTMVFCTNFDSNSLKISVRLILSKVFSKISYLRMKYKK